MTHGTWIPKAVLERVDIPLSARVLYGLIDALDGDEGCYASNGWIATNLALTPRQVQNLLKMLVDAGLVVRIETDGKRILRTVEKQALVALKGDAVNFVPPTKPISSPPRSRLRTDNTEDNKEDNNNPLPLPHSPMFRRVWDEWVAYRRASKKKLSELAKQKQLAMLAGLTEAEAIECINRSISNDWQGLFPEKQKNSKPFSKILTRDDHANGF
jgi:DNA-binding MarR family transcriptional regulator